MLTRVLVVVLGLVACKKQIVADELEKQIASELGARGLKVKVTCPEGTKPKAGDVFWCDAVDDTGAKLSITVKQNDDKGSIEWELDGTAVDTSVLITEIKAKVPNATVTCPRKIVVLKSGERATCKVEGGGETAVLQIKQDGENTSWEIVAAPPP